MISLCNTVFDSKSTVTIVSSIKYCFVGIPCEPPPRVEHANFPDYNAFVGDTRYYQCNRDYWMKRDIYDKTIECLMDAKWNEEVDNCTRKFP